MTERLRELLAAAEPETKGRWVYRRCDFGQGPVDDYSYVEWGAHTDGYGTAALSVPMARYIAACDPDTIRELLDAHDRMAGARAPVTQALRALEEAIDCLSRVSPRTLTDDWRAELNAARAALAVPKEETP